MLNIKAVENEQDFQAMCDIESEVAKHSDFSIYTTHPSHLVFDRYLFGSGSQDVFSYGKLIIKDSIVIGYVLAYLVYTDETQFTVRMLPQYSDYYKTAIESIENMFSNKDAFTVIANSLNLPLCKALNDCEFICGNEERWQSGLNLKKYSEVDLVWQDENIRFLSEYDIDDRVKYADIPTGKSVTRKMYEALIASDYYKTALDYVIRCRKTNDFIGFITWWIDENSKTATLEPADCYKTPQSEKIQQQTV